MQAFLDPVLLARIQFAFTVSFHIIFPAFTIGLASWLAVLEWRWLKTGKKTYESLYKMWVKIFAVTFGMGVVSGVVLSYQFGTNWSIFSDKIGNVIGPLLGYEVLTAFFLEASFLGIMLFGWGKVSKKMHFASTVIVAFGTLVSAFWILSANSWMQTPQGFIIDEQGLMQPSDWIQIIFNPSFPYRFMHMVSAAYLTTACVVAGVAGYYFLYKQDQYLKHAKKMLSMALLIIGTFGPAQLIIGDMHGLNTLKHQPAKVSAMEGIWEDEQGADLRLFANIDEENETNTFELKIPNLAGLILTHSLDGTVKGLKSWPKDERPPVAIVFWSFRIMVTLGMLMILTGLLGAWLYYRKRLYTSSLYHRWCMFMAPAGFIAVLSGWFVTEVGRQPYTVYGVLRTADSISPVMAEQILASLIAFIVVYSFVFGMGCYYIFKLVRKGPAIEQDSEQFYAHGEEHTFVDGIVANKNKGDSHV